MLWRGPADTSFSPAPAGPLCFLPLMFSTRPAASRLARIFVGAYLATG